MAITQTEVYRRFDGALRAHALRFLPITLSGIRVATRRKRPLILLYAVPALRAVASCVFVYMTFFIQEGASSPDAPAQLSMAAGMAGMLLDVRTHVVALNDEIWFFQLLAVTWYGSGLICEDRRHGAHLLYFSRPLTRIDYFLGKLGITAFFGALAILAPTLSVCAFAAVASPEWSFLTEQGDVVVATVVYGVSWVVVVSLIVLAISSLAKRRTFALIGSFAFFVLADGVSRVGVELTRDQRFELISPPANLQVWGHWLFSATRGELGSVELSSLAALGGVCVLAILVLVRQLGRMEVVA